MSDPIRFEGFPPGKTRTVALPAAFITDVLPLIDDLAELKVTLFAFYAVQQREGRFRYVRQRDFASNETLIAMLGDAALLEKALEKACSRGTLLVVDMAFETTHERVYFINAEPGRIAVEIIGRGGWQSLGNETIEILPERPNIYRLYEANVGPLTPMIADLLRDAETDYPIEWIEEAIRAAVEKNALHWRFIQAVLERRRKEGNHREEPERRDERDGKWYLSGKYADTLDH